MCNGHVGISSAAPSLPEIEASLIANIYLPLEILLLLFLLSVIRVSLAWGGERSGTGDRKAFSDICPISPWRSSLGLLLEKENWESEISYKSSVPLSLALCDQL